FKGAVAGLGYGLHRRRRHAVGFPYPWTARLLLSAHGHYLADPPPLVARTALASRGGMQTIRDFMTTDLVCISSTTSLLEAAKLMRDKDIGDVIVTDGDKIAGILTDRDIVVRAV